MASIHLDGLSFRYETSERAVLGESLARNLGWLRVSHAGSSWSCAPITCARSVALHEVDRARARSRVPPSPFSPFPPYSSTSQGL